MFMLVIMDHFMQYMQALVTSSQTAKCTAQSLWDIFIVHYGLQENIVSDQGWNFESDIIAELCNLAEVQKLHSSSYHAQTDGQCKYFNHAVINMLGTLLPKKKSSLRNMVLT